MNTCEKLIKEVEDLNNNTPDGEIVDADTILVDLVQNCDYEFTGFAQDIFNIWKNSADKKAVEQMFYEFTDMEFSSYLMKCKEEITRKKEFVDYDDNLIIGRVPNKIKERTKENMEVYHMGLADSFREAVRTYVKKGTELWKAWYYDDFRKYIPSAYLPEYLDFAKYPLKYADK